MKKIMIIIVALTVSLHCVSQKIDYELIKQNEKYMVEYQGESYYVDTSVFSVSSKYDISSDYIVLRKISCLPFFCYYVLRDLYSRRREYQDILSAKHKILLLFIGIR